MWCIIGCVAWMVFLSFGMSGNAPIGNVYKTMIFITAMLYSLALAILTSFFIEEVSANIIGLRLRNVSSEGTIAYDLFPIRKMVNAHFTSLDGTHAYTYFLCVSIVGIVLEAVYLQSFTLLGTLGVVGSLGFLFEILRKYNYIEQTKGGHLSREIASSVGSTTKVSAGPRTSDVPGKERQQKHSE